MITTEKEYVIKTPFGYVTGEVRGNDIIVGSKKEAKRFPTILAANNYREHVPLLWNTYIEEAD